MYLKKLEMYGFKSFANRMEMSFGQGITGVVGPNGCGKSNIGDAVRWVLGEQSARVLRGGKMEDIIFGGTQKRKALAYCEVSLTFDNSTGLLPIDFSDVMVTRRIYRSGESEYYLNKTACRLKDITDLFRDTGIGKEGYSLIGQGRIDEILSVRSEDRRNVFEEAAGISKYRARKQEAQKRMEHTSLNLARVDDIVDELSSQLAPLAAQAETAKRYIALSSELKTLELNDFLYKHDATESKLGDASIRSLALEEALLQEQLQEQSVRSEIDAAQDTISSIEQQVSAKREEEAATTREIQAREGTLALLQERIHQDTEHLLRFDLEDDTAKSALDALQEQDGDTAQSDPQDLFNMRTEIAYREEHAQSLSMEISTHETALEALKAAIIQGMNRLTSVKSAQARMSATREGWVQRLQALDLQKLSLKSSWDDARLAVEESTKRYDIAEKTYHSLHITLGELEQQRGILQKQKEEAQQLLQRTQGAHREATSRLKMLEQMEKDYEGYQHSVKEVMRSAKSEHDAGIVGVVAELLQVPRDYERAIDMALGGQLQHIVCATQEDAQRHIDRLRQAKAGRATFLPLDAVRGRVLNQSERNCLSMPGCLGVASELIGFDPMYRPIMESLLGRTVIAQDLSSGIAIMRKASHAFRLVTLQGDVMHSGGSMTGGSVQSRMTSLLSREREIGEYHIAVARLQEKEQVAATDLGQIEDAIQMLTDQYHTIQAQYHEQEITIEREQSHKQHAHMQLKERETAGNMAELEREQIATSLLDIDEQLSSMANQAGGEENIAQTAQADVSHLAGAIAKLRTTLDALREDLTQKRVSLASAERDHEAMQRDASRREVERSAHLAGMQQRMQQRTVLLAAQEEKRLTIQEEQDTLALLKQTQTTLYDSYRALEIRRIALQQSLRTQLDKLEQAQKSQNDLSEKRHRLEIQSAKLQADLENLISRIWESYELTYQGAQAYALPAYDQASATIQIDQIRKEIRAMGSVNTSAIEDYMTTSERYETLCTQRGDLQRAQSDLEGIIKEITARMETQFVERFKILGQNFNQTFCTLFGGGRAELRLTDAKDPLGCGIDIVAQPPGKKLQLLSLLSGGERAMTAIAILFSMLQLKPTPFCILDEIEAALDEHNVANFASFLATYALSTQFIVVTHRKGTMECCDSLYGIAMEEKGVSSMVSVELSAVDQLRNVVS